jgi:hypothetical protein
MGALLKIFGGPAMSTLVGLLSGPLLELYKAHLNGKISMEQLQVELKKMLYNAFTQVEVTHAQEMTKTYGSFMETVRESKALQWMLIAVVASQTFVLVWYQWIVPLIVFYCKCKYPSAGSTIDWTYLLIAGLCGLGPVALRGGPAGMATTAQAYKGLAK